MSKKERNFDNKKEDSFKTVKSDLPPEGFQTDKKDMTMSSLSVSDATSSGGVDGSGSTNKNNVAKRSADAIKSKIKVRPDVSVDQLGNKQVGGVPLVGNQSTRSVAGISNMSPADDSSKIPYTDGGYRPTTAFGKKRDQALFNIDEEVCEQVVPKVEDALDLSEEDGKALQVYNGRKQFKQVRAKKNFAFKNGNNTTLPKLPQQLLNDCSVDYIHTSKIVYTSGQMITGATNADELIIPKGMDYPTVMETNERNVSPVPFTMHKGNYRPNAIKIQTTNGKISHIHIDEEYYEVHADPISRDQANMNLHIDGHNVANTVIKLQNELGRETTDSWSPLGYVIHQPYEYNMLYHDIEATTGAIMATAYRAAKSCMAYQCNIGGKDGTNPQRNAIKMMLEGYSGVLANNDSTTISELDFGKMIFRQSEYQRGSAAGIIRMFDSTNKYKTKADILGNPKGLKFHVAKAANNIAPLHCKPEFMKALDKAHMYSTIDGNYNPFLPIFSTRKISLINPLSLNVFLAGWKNPKTLTPEELEDSLRDPETGTYANYSYMYKDIRNPYCSAVKHPLIEGLLAWLLKHEGDFSAVFGTDVNGANFIEIPFDFNFESPSLLSFMLCDAAQDINQKRFEAFRDIIFAGEQKKELPYIWDDLKSLSELDPLKSSQLTIPQDYLTGLKLGKLAPDTALRELWSDHMPLTTLNNNNPDDAGKAQYMLPWYMNEQSFQKVDGGRYTEDQGFFNEDEAYNMSIPSIREGVRHEFVDVIKSMNQRDVRLAMDRRVNIPVFVTDSDVTNSYQYDTDDHHTHTIYSNVVMFKKYNNYNDEDLINNEIKLATLRYDPNSDGRMIAIYDVTHGSNRKFTEKSLYMCAKEIGYIDDDYSSFKIIKSFGFTGTSESGHVTIVFDRTSVVQNIGTLHTAQVYTGHSPMFIDSYRVEADSTVKNNIDRGAALSQTFYRCFATKAADSADVNTKFVSKTGIIPCLGYSSGAALDVNGVYNVGSKNESTHAIDKTIRTFAHRIWTMIQRFFLPINRFENIYSITQGVDYDPLETSFYFGLCGFLASDYSQDIQQRLITFEQLGPDYTEDTFAKDSLIFRAD